MFASDQRDPAPPALSIRDTLFGDQPIETWPPGPAPGEPWATFIAARASLSQGRQDGAIAAWRSITEMPNLESRHYAQAWHFLRAHGVPCPPERAKQLLGIVKMEIKNGDTVVTSTLKSFTAK